MILKKCSNLDSVEGQECGSVVKHWTSKHKALVLSVAFNKDEEEEEEEKEIDDEDDDIGDVFVKE